MFGAVALTDANAQSSVTRSFSGASLQTVEPDPVDVAGFDAFLRRYVAALPVERAAVAHVRVGQGRADDTEAAPAVLTEEQPA